jgi:hypothetical protein
VTPGDPLVDEVGRHPQNEHLLAHLAERAEPARGEYRLGPWELHVHPDLCERLEEVGSTGSAGIHGCCSLVAPGGIIYALGSGTSSILVRLPPGPDRSAAMEHGAKVEPDLGDPWLRVPAWPRDLPSAAATKRLAGWLRAARDAARA